MALNAQEGYLVSVVITEPELDMNRAERRQTRVKKGSRALAAALRKLAPKWLARSFAPSVERSPALVGPRRAALHRALGGEPEEVILGPAFNPHHSTASGRHNISSVICPVNH